MRNFEGNFLLKLNTASEPIAKKYREGKVKRTLERELKVPEIAKREADEASSYATRLHWVCANTHRGGAMDPRRDRECLTQRASCLP